MCFKFKESSWDSALIINKCSQSRRLSVMVNINGVKQHLYTTAVEQKCSVRSALLKS